MLSNTTYILQTGFYQHSLKKCIKFVTKVYNIFNLELLFTGNIPRGVFCEQSSQKTRELSLRSKRYFLCLSQEGSSFCASRSVLL